MYKKKKVYKNTTELWEAIMAAWHAIPIETFHSVCESIPQNLVKVREEKGWRNCMLNKSFYP